MYDFRLTTEKCVNGSFSNQQNFVGVRPCRLLEKIMKNIIRYCNLSFNEGKTRGYQRN